MGKSAFIMTPMLHRNDKYYVKRLCICSAVEKLFMACCTMQPEDDAALPRGFDSEDCEVYQKNNENSSVTGINHDEISLGTSGSASNLFGGSSCMGNSSGGMGNQLGNLFQASGTGSVPLGCTEAMDSLGKLVIVD